MVSRFLVVVIAAALPVAAANAMPTLRQIAPTPATYAYGTDFTQFSGSGIGDVTAGLAAIGGFGTAGADGCEAADFAGFATGSIALIARGTCTFAEKFTIAAAAGASGVLVYNNAAGNAFSGTNGLGPPASLPALALSRDLGSSLFAAAASTPVTIRLRVEENDFVPPPPPPSVPEPAAWLQLIVGLGFVGAARRRLHPA